MSPDTAPSLQIDGARATIRLRRPLEHNRIDPSDLAVLLDHLGQACSDRAVRVLVVTGSGQKTFSSGYTVAAIREHLDDRLEKVLDTLESLPLPMVCTLNGSLYTAVFMLRPWPQGGTMMSAKASCGSGSVQPTINPIH